MEITTELIRAIRSKYDKDKSDTKKEFDTFLCDEIKRMKSITQKVGWLDRDIAKKFAEYKTFKKEQEDKISDLQKSCGHELTTYHPDLSGNNDSHMECEICGKEAKRL